MKDKVSGKKRKSGYQGKKGQAGRRKFSPEELMGRGVCILLVVILTVGAFLAPRMINSLYDANTLMQIEYMDMELSTYEVAYSDFEEKLKTIGSIAAYGEEFAILPVDETAQAVSDQELTDIAAQEMRDLFSMQSFPCGEGWWCELTEENLSAREKDTLYVPRRIGSQENEFLQEIPPLEFWALTFEITEGQAKNLIREKTEEWEAQRKEKGYTDVIVANGVTDEDYILNSIPKRLTVILDAEFYKIYAFTLSGASGSTTLTNGVMLCEMCGDLYTSGERVVTRDDVMLLDMLRTEEINIMLDNWSTYWGVVPQDLGMNETFLGYTEAEEITGWMMFPYNMEKMAESGDTSEDAEDAEAFGDGSAGNGAIAESSAAYAGETNAYDAGANGMEDGYMEVWLEVGFQIKSDNQYESVWTRDYVQKYGLSGFFDMIQF